MRSRSAIQTLVWLVLTCSPYRTVDREDILNVGGFSDQVFGVISEFARGELNADHWIGVIESVTL